MIFQNVPKVVTSNNIVMVERSRIRIPEGNNIIIINHPYPNVSEGKEMSI